MTETASGLPPERRRDLDDLLRTVKELRPLPALAIRLIAMAENTRFSAQDLAAAIRMDQALTLRILRLGNSPTFGLPRRITTLREAIVLLGFREVRSLALAVCVIDDSAQRTVDASVLDYHTFWINSLTVAAFADVLARGEGHDHDEAFSAGIIHNVGRLALAQHRPEWLVESVTLAAQDGIPIHEAQRHLFDFTDAELGAAIARASSFPERLIEAVERHAWPLAAFEDRTSLGYLIVRARRFARHHGIADGVDPVTSRGTVDFDWRQPKVIAALRHAGGIATVLKRGEEFLSESRTHQPVALRTETRRYLDGAPPTPSAPRRLTGSDRGRFRRAE
ncbi:MAG: HDOD domain-containing protein [Chloroflexi bacterium]|nr:HDOD domain-containing protein [Chloroflexota bacterium]